MSLGQAINSLMYEQEKEARKRYPNLWVAISQVRGVLLFGLTEYDVRAGLQIMDDLPDDVRVIYTGSWWRALLDKLGL